MKKDGTVACWGDDSEGGPCEGACSCEGVCGEAPDDESCFCDDVCSEYGDCCPDFASLCEGDDGGMPGPSSCPTTLPKARVATSSGAQQSTLRLFEGTMGDALLSTLETLHALHQRLTIRFVHQRELDVEDPSERLANARVCDPPPA